MFSKANVDIWICVAKPCAKELHLNQSVMQRLNDVDLSAPGGFGKESSGHNLR